MEALDQKLTELEEKERQLQEKKRELEDEEVFLFEEKKKIEQERLKLAKILDPDEELLLKKELTAVGELLELVAVIHGSLRVIRTKPKNPRELYNIDIDSKVAFSSGLVGLRVDVIVYTESPRVEEIVKGLFVQEGFVYESQPLSWERDWDSGTRISLTTHEALS